MSAKTDWKACSNVVALNEWAESQFFRNDWDDIDRFIWGVWGIMKLDCGIAGWQVNG